MNPKQRKKLLKQAKKNKTATNAKAPSGYIAKMSAYLELFNDYPAVKVLINNVIAADRLLKQGLLPQTLPVLLLPDDIQDTIFKTVNQTYPAGDPRGDKVWNKLSAALPDLDKQLRGFRDYLETEYGMWAYISAPFAKALAEFINGRPTLEVMAGNGYVSKGLRDNKQDVIATDSKDWTAENQTGRHPVTEIEQLSASDAFEKYQNQVDVIVMVWSPDGLTIDWDLLQKIRQSDKDFTFIVIGEKNGATDSKEFWDNATLLESPEVEKLNQHFRDFDLIQDRVYLVK
ncbi:SAM-dependent methyltransferase [Secundilactobacillus paracollinoides]|uniref:SAM-dependent methyltransferase n=1 Tax=Secundilactobacillus paracollinoides TaxID=240427 RepID=UPI00081A4F51|nr:SAM-dependent methyltransferase [Secundilactobacillus paracollinoides]ANZ65296.1 SAM-dependent methyltransferase [Secundilactobacillus paracollinoides]